MTTICASRLPSPTSRTSVSPLPSGRFLSMMSRSQASPMSFLRASASDSAGLATKPIPSTTSSTTERTTSSSSTTSARIPSPTTSGIPLRLRGGPENDNFRAPQAPAGTVEAMRIGTRALLIMVPVAVLPLVGAGSIAFRVSRRALEERTRAAQIATARFIAERVAAEVSASLHAASLAANAMEFAQLSAPERLGALRLVFRQIEGAVAVALLSREGAQVAPPVYLASRAQESSLADREVLGQADIDEFAGGIPLDAAARIGAAGGPAHVSREGSPRVAVAVRTRGDLVLAVEFSLARLAPLVVDSGLGVRGNAAVVDRSGRVVLG